MADDNDTSLAQIDADIVVVGAGVAGLAAAAFASADANVVVLERESQPAYHSSGRSAAMYIEGYENSVVAELTSASGAFFRDPPKDCAQNPLLKARGGLTIAGLDEVQALENYCERWQQTCPNLAAIDVDQALQRCGGLNPDRLSGAAYDPDWKSIDTHELMLCYQRMLKANLGQLINNAEVTKIWHDGGSWQIQTRNQKLTAQVVVNAAGAWANRVAELADITPLPLTPLRRTAAIIPAPLDSEDWPLVHTISESLYFKPESPGLMVCPQDETPTEPMDAYPEDMDVAIAIERLQQLTRIEVKRVMHQWAGIRTFAPDRYPAVGYESQASGFFWLAGQGGFGVQTSPRLGQICADAIAKQLAVASEISVQRLR